MRSWYLITPESPVYYREGENGDLAWDRDLFLTFAAGPLPLAKGRVSSYSSPPLLPSPLPPFPPKYPTNQKLIRSLGGTAQVRMR